jgi:RNA polymerase sigma-70 factor (ECF subfamily)
MTYATSEALTFKGMVRREHDSGFLAHGTGGSHERPLSITSDVSLEFMDEAHLISRLVVFDTGAWDAIFERYFPSIYRLAYVRTRDPAAAEDIAAQTFAEAAQGIQRYRYRGVPFRAWLYRIARNLTSDHLKAERRQSRVPLDETAPLAAPEAEAEGYVDFVAALEELTDDQKTVVTLRLVDGYSLAEVAGIVGKSVGAVKQLQFRAIGVLQRHMAIDRVEDRRS